MSNYTFEVDTDNGNAVSIFVDTQEAPMILQPDWPDNTPWASAEEATAWAEVFIESLINPDAEVLPGYSPDEPTRAKPAAPEAPAE
jgi:hypothetical protein